MGPSFAVACYYLRLKILNAPLQHTDRVSNKPPNYIKLHTKLWNWFEKLFLLYYELNHKVLSTFVQPLVCRLDRPVSHVDGEWYMQLLVDYHPIPKADPINVWGIHIILFDYWEIRLAKNPSEEQNIFTLKFSRWLNKSVVKICCCCFTSFRTSSSSDSPLSSLVDNHILSFTDPCMFERSDRPMTYFKPPI